MYKCQDVLEKKVEEIRVKVKDEMRFDLNALMFRDYMVKIEVVNEFLDVLLIFNLYYSPKKGSFRQVVELEKDMMVGGYISRLIDSDTRQKKPLKTKTVTKEYRAVDEDSGYMAYTDGSYIRGCVGYGAVLLYKGEIIRKFSGSVDGVESFRQVAGELKAIIEIVGYCEQNGINTVRIVYDYTGIREWAVDAWQAKNHLTKAYKERMKHTSVNIIWEKVKAHSGNQYNEMADELAKQGALTHTGERFMKDK